MYITKLQEILRSLICFVSGTNRGRLLLFDAVVRGQVVETNEPIKEHVETKLIVKVAHEVKKLVRPRFWSTKISKFDF